MDSLRSLFEKGYQQLFNSTGAHLLRYREVIEPITGPLPKNGIRIKNGTLTITVSATDASGVFLKKQLIKKTAQEAVPHIVINHIRFITR